VGQEVTSTWEARVPRTRRRVYRRNRDGTPDRILAAITLDIDDITTA
jgi:hypothetical protein